MTPRSLQLRGSKERFHRMPEGPGSEGRRGPPPIPPEIAGSSASGAVAPHPPGEVQTPHERAASPVDPGPFVELAALLARETESAGNQKRRADLLVRLGLLFWDVLDDSEAAHRYLVAAGTDHPSAL